MATDVIMPALGVAQETGKVLRWLRKEGDAVEQGAPIMEIETDKVTVEVEAPASGTLAGIRAPEGTDVPVGEVVAVILAAGEDARASEHQARDGDGVPAPRARRRLASPKAKRIAAERGIDVTALTGSGPGVAADLEAVQAPAASPPVSSIWRLMAERTTEAWRTAPHFYLSREVDTGRLVAWR